MIQCGGGWVSMAGEPVRWWVGEYRLEKKLSNI